MKKRLLSVLMAVICVVGAYADGYIYSNTAKYKFTGNNLFTNGALTNDQGWTNESGGSYDGDVWAFETKSGPNGENVFMSKGASAEEGTTLKAVVPVTAGTSYVVSYWAKGEASMITSTDATSGANYVDFFLNASGDNTIMASIASTEGYTTDWKQYVYFVTANFAYLVFNAKNVATGTMFTNFEVYAATEVFDSRIVDRKLDYMNKLLAEPDFTAERDGMEEFVAILSEVSQDPATIDSPDEMEAILAETDGVIDAFLAANAGNLIGTTDESGNRTERYLYDWSRWSYSNWNNITNRNTWHFDGGRWGFSPNDESLERPAGDGYVASAGIQTNYTLDVGLWIADGALDGTSLKPGKYMFSIEAQAVASANKAAPYGSDHSLTIKEPWMWVGSDTIHFTDVVLNDFYWQRLYYIAEVKEGEEITAGFHFPVTDTNKGGRYSLRNPEFRAVGMTQDEVDHLYAYDQLLIQKNALQIRLDSANMVNAYTKAEGYPWGHKVLGDSIAKFTATYDDLSTVIAADGTELNADRVTLEFKDEILAAVQAMNSAISNYYTTNKSFQTLVATIEVSNASLNAAANAAGDKATFKAVIDEAQGMVDATAVDADEVEAFDAENEKLLYAKEAFEMGTASRANPTDLYIQNILLEAWDATIASNPNIGVQSSDTDVKTTTSNGWEFYSGEAIKQWQVRASDEYESGKNLNAWRGTSVAPNGRARKIFNITKPGLYEYRVKAYSCESGDGAHWTEYMAIAKMAQVIDFETFDMVPVDTIYLPQTRLFFGKNGLVDSLTVTKCAPEYAKYSRVSPLTYSIFFEKTDNASTEMEFGLEVKDNNATAGPNSFGFGDNHVYYVGDKAAYEAATKADLEAEITKAKALIAQHKDHESQFVQNIIARMYRYMGETENMPEGIDFDTPAAWNIKKPAAMNLQEMQNTYLTLIELENMLTYVTDWIITGIDSVVGAEGIQQQAAAKGIYSITGVKMGNDINALPKGLYIINGKKYMVK